MELKNIVISENNNEKKVPVTFKPFNSESIYDILAGTTCLVIIEECYQGETPLYMIDIAEPWGSYIDNFWDTQNDWVEGIGSWHVVAYAPLYDELWTKNPMDTN